jgi:hypothetical protein
MNTEMNDDNRLEKSYMEAGRFIGNRSLSVSQASSGNRFSFRDSSNDNTRHNIYTATMKIIRKVRTFNTPFNWIIS